MKKLIYPRSQRSQNSFVPNLQCESSIGIIGLKFENVNFGIAP